MLTINIHGTSTRATTSPSTRHVENMAPKSHLRLNYKSVLGLPVFHCQPHTSSSPDCPESAQYNHHLSQEHHRFHLHAPCISLHLNTRIIVVAVIVVFVVLLLPIDVLLAAIVITVNITTIFFSQHLGAFVQYSPRLGCRFFAYVAWMTCLDWAQCVTRQ